MLKSNKLNLTKPKGWLSIFLMLLVAGTLLVGGLYLLRYLARDWIDDVNQNLDNATIEDYTRIKLPTPATNIRGFSERGQDRITYVKFDLPPTNLSACLKAAGYSAALTPQYMPNQFDNTYLSHEINWWQSNQAKIFAGASFRAPPAPADKGMQENVLVDQTNPQLYTVYFMNFTMYLSMRLIIRGYEA
jgi:hypothetical protein